MSTQRWCHPSDKRHPFRLWWDMLIYGVHWDCRKTRNPHICGDERSARTTAMTLDADPGLVNFRIELIQTAAVIVSALEDLDYGMADSSVMQETPEGFHQGQSRTIVNLILEERRRQDAKWGPKHHRMADWLVLIGEEYGEACKAYVDDLL